jgi:transposase
VGRPLLYKCFTKLVSPWAELRSRARVRATVVRRQGKRWIVERTFAWLSRFRRLARDFERYARTVAAFIHLAMIRIMLKRLVASSSS